MLFHAFVTDGVSEATVVAVIPKCKTPQFTSFGLVADLDRHDWNNLNVPVEKPGIERMRPLLQSTHFLGHPADNLVVIG